MNGYEIRTKIIELAIQVCCHNNTKDGGDVVSTKDIINTAKELYEFIESKRN